MSGSINKPLGQQALDQALHLMAAVIVLAPVLLFPNVWGAAGSGLLVGLVREVTEAGRVTASMLGRVMHSVTTPGSMLDVLFWAVGGALAGLAFL